MTATLKSRQRIARVRCVQHRLALMNEARGRTALESLSERSALIARLHATMTVTPGPTNGAAIARASELASRFAMAGIGVAQEQGFARSRLAALTDQRIASERDRDGAAKLVDAAQSAQQAAADKRAGRFVARRPGSTSR